MFSKLPAYQYPDGTVYCYGFASVDLREVCRQLLVLGYYPSAMIDIRHPDTDKVLRTVCLGDVLDGRNEQ